VLAESDRHCYMNVVLKVLAATITINGCMPIDLEVVESKAIQFGQSSSLQIVLMFFCSCQLIWSV
jgi:hypothetical protein